MPDRFAGRHVLVTGGARSIGFEIARRFCAEGATASILDYDRETLDAAVTSPTARVRAAPRILLRPPGPQMEWAAGMVTGNGGWVFAAAEDCGE